MDLTLLAALALAGAAACAGPWITRFAGKRAMAQPLPVDHALERRIVVLAEEHGIDTHTATLCAAWFCDLEAAARFKDASKTTRLVHEDLKQALLELEALHKDRNAFPGACGYAISEKVPFIERNAPFSGRSRVIATSLAAAASSALAVVAGRDAPGVGALIVLAVAGLVVALVDHDTLYLDLRTWWTLSPIAMLLAAISAPSPMVVLAGLITAAALWGGLELLNLVYRLLTGGHGIGGGDGMMGFPVTFVLISVSGSLLVAWWGLVLAFITAGTVVLPRAAVGRSTGSFALGPYLLVGWHLSLLAWRAGMLG
jgi:hypothetical protein